MKVGDIYKTTQSGDVEVVGLVGKKRCMIRFLDTGTLKESLKQSVKQGVVLDTSVGGYTLRFKKRFTEKYGSSGFDLSDTTCDSSANSLVTIVCVKHGPFSVRANRALYSPSGCVHCDKEQEFESGVRQTVLQEQHAIDGEGENYLEVPTNKESEIVLIDWEYSHLIPSVNRFLLDVTSTGYKRIRLKAGNNRGKTLSRVLAESVLGKRLPENVLIDHINRNPLDNRLENLRLATNRLNANNKGAPRAKVKRPCVDGTFRFSLQAGIDSPDGTTYKLATPSIRCECTVDAAWDYFNKLLRQDFFLLNTDNLVTSEEMFNKIFSIAAEESKTRRLQDVSLSKDEWFEKNAVAFRVAEEVRQSDRKFIEAFSKHPLGTTLKVIKESNE